MKIGTYLADEIGGVIRVNRTNVSGQLVCRVVEQGSNDEPAGSVVTLAPRVVEQAITFGILRVIDQPASDRPGAQVLTDNPSKPYREGEEHS